MLQSPFAMAVARSLAGAVLLGASSFLVGWNPDDVLSTNNAIKDGLVAGVGYLVLRGGFEGTIDQARAWAGHSMPADVPNVIRRQDRAARS